VSLKNPSTVDHTLLARVAKGDQEAFERLYAQTSSLLYARWREAAPLIGSARWPPGART